MNLCAIIITYNIESNLFAKKNSQLIYNSNKHSLWIDSNWEVDFSNNVRIIINKFAQTGYFVFGFDMKTGNEKPLEILSKLVFFRFFNEDKKYELSIVEKIDEGKKELEKFTMKHLLIAYFERLLPYIKFTSPKADKLLFMDYVSLSLSF